MNPLVLRTAKAAAALVVLGIIVAVIAGWWGEYKRSSELLRSAPAETSSTPTATPSPAKKPKEGSTTSKKKTKPAEVSPADSAKPKADIVIVEIDGLNFRKDPEAGATPIRGLNKGERLVLLQAQGGWYQVRASDGTEGWVSANKGYTTIVKQ